MKHLAELASREHKQRLDVLRFNKNLLACGGDLTADSLYYDEYEGDLTDSDDYEINDSDEEAYEDRGGDM